MTEDTTVAERIVQRMTWCQQQIPSYITGADSGCRTVWVMVKEEVTVLPTRMGGVCIRLNYLAARINGHPVLVMDFFSYTRRYDLPAGTPQ
ncbi:hypothetical protein HX362_004613 [Salmonella enterica]|nr:hypothetical protein [Salmonella enterica]